MTAFPVRRDFTLEPGENSDGGCRPLGSSDSTFPAPGAVEDVLTSAESMAQSTSAEASTTALGAPQTAASRGPGLGASVKTTPSHLECPADMEQ